MKNILHVVAICFIAFAQPAMARETPPSFADMVETLSPAVVNISTTQKVKANTGPSMQFQGLPQGEEYEPFREFFERFYERFGDGGMLPKEQNVTSLGSGFVVDPEGYIVTNNHVVEQADEVTVTFQDDSKFEAKVVGKDAKTDLALLKIETNKKLPFVTFGDSDEMRVGDWVIAIGNPFGLGGSVSAGIVSARSRNINAGPFDDFIQTDAAINRGNSGGPLFNINGEVIGVNSAIFSPSGGNIGIGFAIPSTLVKPVLQQLREYGRTHRGWLGVKIQHVTEEIADSIGLKSTNGALVLEVNPKSPADKAGVEVGDVILSFNGQAIREMRKLPRLVAETKVGTKVGMTVWRKGDEKNLSITLGEMEEEETDQAADSQGESKQAEQTKTEEYLGLKLMTLTRSLRKEYNIEQPTEGVVVLGVEPGTVGDTSGLRRYDIIIEANQKPVESVDELKAAIKEAGKQDKKHALLRVSRGGTVMFVTIPVKK
jgi:serine protease Do